MSENTAEEMRATIETIYQTESRRVLATLIRLLGDFDLAEEGLQEAFAAALTKWPREGMPANPRAWLISTGRYKAIDSIRRRTRFDASLRSLAEEYGAFEPGAGSEVNQDPDSDEIEDDRLRLIFTCCHPALQPDAQVALTLRTVCGLTTEEIAAAFLIGPPTLAQRIVRAKAKIRDAGIPYEVPEPDELSDRLDFVLQVIYLIFNEGYYASSGAAVTRHDLSSEAIRLGRLLNELFPQPEVMGLLSLMLLLESRRPARTSPSGDLILLDDQDRTLWDQNLIAEGLDFANRALASNEIGPYTIQAAIASVHARAQSSANTDWNQIVELYTILLRADPNPVVQLNRAVAIAMRDGPAAGLVLIDAILARGDLADYHFVYAARADLLRRAGRLQEAQAGYKRALELARQEPERRFLEKRLRELDEGLQQGSEDQRAAK
jgi:RNA polymerase sigma-70 factor, ECF subfamily